MVDVVSCGVPFRFRQFLGVGISRYNILVDSAGPGVLMEFRVILSPPPPHTSSAVLTLFQSISDARKSTGYLWNNVFLRRK